jgi:hypothetical protein
VRAGASALLPGSVPLALSALVLAFEFLSTDA